MTKRNLTASLSTGEVIKCKIPTQEVSEKLDTVSKFMEERKKWEKGLFTSKTIIK